jgi:hypothetical protein
VRSSKSASRAGPAADAEFFPLHGKKCAGQRHTKDAQRPIVGRVSTGHLGVGGNESLPFFANGRSWVSFSLTHRRGCGCY